MKMKKLLVSFALLSFAMAAKGQMLNVSSNNLADYFTANVACAIIGDYTEFVITAEGTSNTDAGVYLVTVPDDGTFIYNDDWTNYSPATQAFIVSAIGRPLNKPTDAAILGSARNIGICAWAGDNIPSNPLRFLNVSITETVFPSAVLNQNEIEIMQSDQVEIMQGDADVLTLGNLPPWAASQRE